jgi:hypothetical protein
MRILRQGMYKNRLSTARLKRQMSTIEKKEPRDLEVLSSTWHNFSTSARLYRSRPWLFITVAACTITLYDLVVFLATGYRPFGHSSGRVDFWSLSGGVGFLMIIPVVAALDAYVLSVSRQSTELRQTRTALGVLRTLPGVMVSLVTAYLGIGIAGIFFVIPGLILWLRWFVVAPVVAVERLSIIGALKRSARLTAGHYWYVLVLLMTLWLAVLIVAFCIHVIFEGSTVNIGIVAMEIVTQSLIASYIALPIAVLYFDLCAVNIDR